MSDDTRRERLSDRATAEWFPSAEPPVFVVETEDPETGHEMEVYLEPAEVEALEDFHRGLEVGDDE